MLWTLPSKAAKRIRVILLTGSNKISDTFCAPLYLFNEIEYCIFTAGKNVPFQADTKSTPSYSSELAFLGNIMQLSVV